MEWRLNPNPLFSRMYCFPPPDMPEPCISTHSKVEEHVTQVQMCASCWVRKWSASSWGQLCCEWLMRSLWQPGLLSGLMESTACLPYSTLLCCLHMKPGITQVVREQRGSSSSLNKLIILHCFDPLSFFGSGGGGKEVWYVSLLKRLRRVFEGRITDPVMMWHLLMDLHSNASSSLWIFNSFAAKGYGCWRLL